MRNAGGALMTRSKEFVRDLQRRLTESSANRRYDWKDGLEWKPERGERQSVDLVGQPQRSGRLLLIEVELRRGDPSSNVLKIWLWKCRKKLKNDFILFQAFSRYYNKKNRTLIKRALFLGDRMQKDTERPAAIYIPIKFRYLPGKSAKTGGGARRHRARYLAGRILREMRRLKLA
jgi:hypothetical protein